MRRHVDNEAGVKCDMRGGKMRGTGARYQCEAMGNLRRWNVRGAKDNWRSRCHPQFNFLWVKLFMNYLVTLYLDLELE